MCVIVTPDGSKFLDAAHLAELTRHRCPVLAARGGHMMDELALGDYLDQAQHEL